MISERSIPVFKRFTAFSLVLLLLGLCCSPALADNMQAGSMYVYTPNGKALYFRATRSTTEDTVITQIPYGSKVYVVYWDGTWARIQYNGEPGFVVKRYLQIGPPAPYEVVQAQNAQKNAEKEARQALNAAQKKLDHSAIKTVEEYEVTVRLDVVSGSTNLYAKSSLLSNILRECPNGTRFTVVAQNKDWAKVYDAASDQKGYVLRADLVEDETEEEIPED